MSKTCRYKSIDMKAIKRFFSLMLIVTMLCSCSLPKDEAAVVEETPESADDSFVDFQKLGKENSDIFAWIHVPDTDIDYPVVQDSFGDDSFYASHNVKREPDEKGAIYIEAANLKDMCDFNEVLHGSSPDDGTMFASLVNYLDKSFFDEHPYIYIYMDGNALLYYTFAAFTRDDTRLLAEYDFTYASGCQAFLDEIYSQKSMNKIIRKGWEGAVEPDNFIITLTTTDPRSYKQIVVVGCLVGDVAGKIDRIMDYGDPEEQ